MKLRFAKQFGRAYALFEDSRRVLSDEEAAELEAVADAREWAADEARYRTGDDNGVDYHFT